MKNANILTIMLLIGFALIVIITGKAKLEKNKKEKLKARITRVSLENCAEQFEKVSNILDSVLKANDEADERMLRYLHAEKRYREGNLKTYK